MVTPEPSQAIKPAWDLVSELAEIAAFFLVTIDLYGEERLQALNKSISWLLSRTLARIRLFRWRDKDNPLPIGTVSGFILRFIGQA